MTLYHDTCHHRIYALSCEQFDALHAYADGRCELCRLPEQETKRGRLSIDHLRDYGGHTVRGLLCDRCNALMGRVDRGGLSAVPRSYWQAVIDYRHNAWFARQVHPRGPNVTILPNTTSARGKLVARHTRALVAYVEEE